MTQVLALAGDLRRRAGAPATGLRVLVAEDDDSSTALALLLGLVGHAVRLADSGPAALGAVREWQPDALLLDHGLPGMSGWEVAREVRALGLPRRPLIVAVTGYGAEEDRRRSAEAGVYLHFAKPADPAGHHD